MQVKAACQEATTQSFQDIKELKCPDPSRKLKEGIFTIWQHPGRYVLCQFNITEQSTGIPLHHIFFNYSDTANKLVFVIS